MVKICFTGGGSAGHVIPNIALIEKAQELGWAVSYIGSYEGIEETLITDIGVDYVGISTGKLRRCLSFKNCLTPFQVVAGILQAYRHLRQLQPDMVFSKGGFVAFPVVFAAWCRRIPVMIHESDLTPGLANRLSFPFASQVCVTFPEGKAYFSSKEKVIVSGTPIREQLLHGDSAKGLQWCDFNKEKPIVLVMGGGMGAQAINETVRESLAQLLMFYQVIHICGAGKCDPGHDAIPGYKQVQYIKEPLADVFACADIVVSRAGANSLYEILLLKKPHVLIPLSLKASRGDQIDNASYYQRLGLSDVLFEEDLNSETLLAAISRNLEKQADIQAKLAKANILNGSDTIMQAMKKLVSA